VDEVVETTIDIGQLFPGLVFQLCAVTTFGFESGMECRDELFDKIGMQ